MSPMRCKWSVAYGRRSSLHDASATRRPPVRKNVTASAHAEYMGLQAWLTSLPGVVVAGLLGYLNQLRLQRLALEHDQRAAHYLGLVALLNQHNRQMWKRYELMTPSSEPHPSALISESDLVRRADLLASPAVRWVLSDLLDAIICWREKDEHRLDPDPEPAARLRRYPNLPQWFGYRTPGQEEFERAGEEADDRFNELCEVIRAELHPHDSRRARALATGDGWLVSGLRRITGLFPLTG